MGVYQKRNQLYIRFKGPEGWVNQRTPYHAGQEREAQRYFDQVVSMLAAGAEVSDPLTGKVTVNRYADHWLKQREADQVADLENDRTRLKLHIRPTIGEMLLTEVRPRDLIKLARQWRAAMAPKTVYNCYSIIKAMFRDALIDELILSSPAVLTEQHLGPMVDADPNWRDTAVFTRTELEQLISDTRLPIDRRVFYALEGVGALRHGEAAGLRFKHLFDREPLVEMTVSTSYDKGRTKTGKRRFMPVHPVLAAMLAEWKLSGWERAMGREPKPEDLVVPVTENPSQGRQRPVGSMRSRHYSRAWFVKDLVLLGMRHRRGHDLRRTMISLAQDDGADEGKLYRCTHNPKGKGKIIERYTTLQWITYCAEVAKLKLRRRDWGLVVPLAVGAGEAAGHLERQAPVAALVTGLVTQPASMADLLTDEKKENPRRILGFSGSDKQANETVEAPGIEPCPAAPVEAAQGRLSQDLSVPEADARPVETGPGEQAGNVGNELLVLPLAARLRRRVHDLDE